MGLKEELHLIERSYQVHLWQTFLFTAETTAQLEDSREMPQLYQELARMTEDERTKVWAAAQEAIERGLAQFPAQAGVEGQPLARWPPPVEAGVPSVTLRVLEGMYHEAITPRRIGYLGRMALIYIVVLMESFTQEYLLQLYGKRPLLLKSRKQVTFEELVSYRSISQLRQALAKKEVEQLSYQGIEGLPDYLDSKFNLDIRENRTWWPVCIEANLRRNLFVHNRGIVNAKYASAISDAPEPGTELDVSIPYLRDATRAMKEYVDFMHTQLTGKLKIR